MNEPFMPLRATIEVYTPGTPERDRRGNLVPGPGSWRQQKIASWWVDRTEEKGDDSILRTIDYLHAHFPAGHAPDPGGKLRTPDGQQWQVIGNTEDYNHGWHGWSPGLVVVNATKVEG